MTLVQNRQLRLLLRGTSQLQEVRLVTLTRTNTQAIEKAFRVDSDDRTNGLLYFNLSFTNVFCLFPLDLP